MATPRLGPSQPPRSGVHANVTDPTEVGAVDQSWAVQVRRVEAALRTALQPVLDEHDLTLDHWRIISVVEQEPGLTMSEVAHAAVVPPATLTRHVDHLVDRGILLRRMDTEDKRRVVVALSPRGGEYAARLRAAERSVALPDAVATAFG